MAEKIIEVQGVDELISNIDKVVDGMEKQLKIGVEKAMVNIAQDIKVIYKGGTSPGFKDRTGALRNSIVGGLDSSRDTSDIVGFVGAGDDSRGSEGKSTREYVEYIEFGEFSKAGSTSFLRAGFQKSQRQIQSIIAEEINLERLL